MSAKEGADIEFSGKIKSLDPGDPKRCRRSSPRSPVGKKIFGLATMNVRFS